MFFVNENNLNIYIEVKKSLTGMYKQKHYTTLLVQ